jgi:hypothetical protein
VYWSPWPGYRERAGFGTGFAWGVGIALGAEFFFGAFDWQQRRVNVVNVNNYYYPRNTAYANRAANTWQHEPEHRRGIPYRAPAVREKFSRAVAAPESRRDFRGNAPAAAAQPARNDNRQETRPADTRNDTGNRQEQRNTAKPAAVAAPAPDARDGRNTPRDTPREATPDTKPAATTPAARPAPRDDRAGRNEQRVTAQPQPAAAAPAPRPEPRNQRSDPPATPAAAARPVVEQAPHALEGVGRGAETRNASERGRTSSAPAPRPPERVVAPAAPPPRAAAPTPPRAAAPAPPARAAAPAPAPRENPRENKGKGRD